MDELWTKLGYIYLMAENLIVWLLAKPLGLFYWHRGRS